MSESKESGGSLPEHARWTLEGRLVEASNVVLRMADVSSLAEVPDDPSELPDDAARAVFKPVAGERPLADFPRGTLAHREVAASVVCAALGWDHVPETRWFEDDLGEGSLQRWVGPLVPTEQAHVALLDEEEFVSQQGSVHPIAAFEGEEGPLVLVHTDTPALRRIAVFDTVTNNADRKGSHLIETPEALFAIDNGLTFHTDDKLRTVLWGFAGDPLEEPIENALRRLVAARGQLTQELASLLTPAEIEALHARTDALLESGTFPDPPEERYGLPWPPL
ncbi:SCO1664 family protein [Dermacoccus abyssi]